MLYLDPLKNYVPFDAYKKEFQLSIPDSFVL